MPATKRASKVMSYNEQDDDDDDFVSIVDKNRTKKSNVSSKQTLQKNDEKSVDLSKSKQAKSKELPEQAIIEIDDEESSDSQSTGSVSENKTSDIDDQDENLSPKNKRMKHDEEDDTDENEEESIDKPEETIKKTEIPTTDVHNCSIRISDLPKRNSSVPLGFPTSKINIPSPHVSRVGLSRKSLTIKPLHPNFTSRVLPE